MSLFCRAIGVISKYIRRTPAWSSGHNKLGPDTSGDNLVGELDSEIGTTDREYSIEKGALFGRLNIDRGG